MESKKFTWQECFAYIYVAFAKLTDGELSDEELNSIKEKVIFWGDEDQEMSDFRQAMTDALKWFRSTTDKEKQVNTVLEIAETLIHEPWFDMSNKNRVISDLIDLAMVDGVLHENEKVWILEIANTWGIEVDF